MLRVENKQKTGFTIVELLIVIVVIAILAAIAIVSYQGITDSARESSGEARLQSLISQLEIYNVQNGGYPESLDDLLGSSGVIASDGYVANGSTYCVSVYIAEGAVYHRESDTGDASTGRCAGERPDLATAPENCFQFNSGSQYITGYFTNEDNNGANPACPTEFTTPESIGGISVLGIGDSAFNSNTYVERIVIESGVTTIETSAFQAATSLWYAYIPATVTNIGTNAFAANSTLNDIGFENGGSTLSVGNNAFANTGLASVVLPGQTSTINTAAFTNAASLTEFRVREGLNELEITSSYFAGTPLESLKLPSNTTLISGSAFSGLSSLTSAEITSGGANPLTITGSSFTGTSLTSFTIPSHAELVGAARSKTSLRSPRSL